MSDLVQRQERFAEYLACLILWIRDQGWRVTLGEGYVGDSIDKPSEDTPHLRRGLHFKRLAQDLVLRLESGGPPITDGAHPAWLAIGEHWESLHLDCRWGGRFGDANHVSLTDGVYGVSAGGDPCPFREAPIS